MKKRSIEHCIDYILDHENEDFYEYPSSTHIYYHAVLAKYGKKEADKRLNEAHRLNGHTCIVCGESMGSESTEDYEFWPTHLNCLGPYDAWIDDRDHAYQIYKKGFESEHQAMQVIKQDYPNAKHIQVKKVR